MERPIPLEYRNNTPKLEDLCETYLDACETENTTDSDLPQYIFQAAMEFIYGKKVWDYINAIDKMKRPPIKEDWSGDFEKLANLADKYMTLSEESTLDDSDIEFLICNAVIEMIYGKGVWDYLANRSK